MLENDGCIWNNTDQHKLVNMRRAGKTFTAIAAELGRTDTACLDRFNRIMTGILFLQGGDNDTIKTIKERYNGKG